MAKMVMYYVTLAIVSVSAILFELPQIMYFGVRKYLSKNVDNKADVLQITAQIT
jgi:hypothetical protein